MTDISTYGGLPGIGSLRQTAEKVVWWGRQERLLDIAERMVDSTAVDAGNTPTTELRAGLLLGIKTSDNNLYQWDGDATDGTEVIAGVLLRDISMLDADGVVEDKYAHVLLAGPLKARDLLIQGTLFTSHADEHLARRQLTAGGRFLLDDEYTSGAGFLGAPLKTKTVAGDTTVTAADNGTLFIATTADADFTLPTLEAGLVFEFLRASDHEMAVISAEGDNIIVGNDLSADSVTFTTAGQQIGAMVRVRSVYVGTTLKWLMDLPSPPFGTGLTGGFAYAIATA